MNAGLPLVLLVLPEWYLTSMMRTELPVLIQSYTDGQRSTPIEKSLRVALRVLMLIAKAMSPRRSPPQRTRMLDGNLGAWDAKQRIDFSNVLMKVVLIIAMF